MSEVSPSLTLTCVGVLSAFFFFESYFIVVVLFCIYFFIPGITSEMTNQTILRCLEEVDHSRPYFVGIISHRYGWHQETDGSDVALTKTFEFAETEPKYLLFHFNYSILSYYFDILLVMLG
jgi:hypothetical protein